MDTMIYEVSSVTMAQAGKLALQRAGLSAYIGRQYDATGTNGCGYILSLQADPDRVLRILAEAGVKVRGVRKTNH